MFVVLIPAVVRLLLAPRDDIWTGLLVLMGMGAAFMSLMWDMDTASVDGDTGVDWELWLTLGGAGVIAGAELWRWIRRRGT